MIVFIGEIEDGILRYISGFGAGSKVIARSFVSNTIIKEARSVEVSIKLLFPFSANILQRVLIT